MKKDQKTKTVIEEAYNDLNKIKEEAKNNAISVLASSMPEKFNEIVKESLSDVLDSEEEEGPISEQEIEELGGEEEVTADEVVDDAAAEDDEIIVTEEELEAFLGEEEQETTEAPAEEAPAEEGEAIDMVDSSDEEVIETYESLGDDAEVEVVDEAAEGSEDELTEADLDALSDEHETSCEEDGALEEGAEEATEEVAADDDEAMIESICKELDEALEAETSEETEETQEEEAEEMEESVAHVANHKASARSATSKVAAKERNKTKKENSRAAMKESAYQAEIKRLKKKANALVQENAELKDAGQQYQGLLETYSTQMKEMLLFNKNLANVNRIFVENATTAAEKRNIVERFDKVENLNESESLFKTISGELKSKPSLNETVAKKTAKTTQDKPVQKITETVAYESDDIKKMKKLMNLG